MDQIYDVEFQNVIRKFDQFIAVDDVSFGIKKGEFFSMLGPSGSGKTTCLRMVAGFQDTSSGRVLLEGVDVTGIPPYKRNVNTVFQDYALFPHMSVAENVGYGLKIKNIRNMRSTNVFLKCFQWFDSLMWGTENHQNCQVGKGKGLLLQGLLLTVPAFFC